MKTVELKPREFHRRIGWALAEARRGVAVVIAAPGQPAVTLTLGRPGVGKRSPAAGGTGRAAWLKAQPRLATNPVDDLRAEGGDELPDANFIAALHFNVWSNRDRGSHVPRHRFRSS